MPSRAMWREVCLCVCVCQVCWEKCGHNYAVLAPFSCPGEGVIISGALEERPKHVVK